MISFFNVFVRFQPRPPTSRLQGRNSDWRHLFNKDVISVPDKWEYPWVRNRKLENTALNQLMDFRVKTIHDYCSTHHGI